MFELDKAVTIAGILVGLNQYLKVQWGLPSKWAIVVNFAGALLGAYAFAGVFSEPILLAFGAALMASGIYDFGKALVTTPADVK